LFSVLTFLGRAESEWPDSNDQVDDIGQALDVRKDLLIDTVEDKFDRFNDLVSYVAH
jgi:hypothetical protein